MATAPASHMDALARPSDDINTSGSLRPTTAADTTPGPYPAPPTDTQLEEIRLVISETGQPERVRTLNWSRPDKAQAHTLILPKITVDRRLRPGGEMVRCSLCSPERPKCLSFYLLWCEGDGRLRIVGPTCGPKHFGVQEFRGMVREAKAAARRKAHENLLLDTLGDLPLWLEDLDRLGALATRLRRLRLAFAKKVPRLHSELLQAHRAGQRELVVMRKQNAEGPAGFRSSTGGAAYLAIPVAPFLGGSFTQPHFTAPTDIESMRSSLLHIVSGWGPVLTDDDILNIVANMDAAAITRAADVIVAAHRKAPRIAERLADMAAFLSDANLAGLQTWGRHAENSLRFGVRVHTAAVTFTLGGGEYVTLERDGLAPAWPQHLGPGLERAR